MIEGEGAIYGLSKLISNKCKYSTVRTLDKMDSEQRELSRRFNRFEEPASLNSLTCGDCGLAKTCNSCAQNAMVLSNRPPTQSRKRRMTDSKHLSSSQDFLSVLIDARNSLPKYMMHRIVVSEKIEHYISAASTLTNLDLLNHLVSIHVEYVQQRMRPLLHKLMTHQKNGDIFNSPVDSVQLGLPDYAGRIKNPMDLGTVKCKLLQGDYHSEEECVTDIHLVFKNAMDYYPPLHAVHQCAVLLQDEFRDDLRCMQEKCAKEVCCSPPAPPPLCVCI